jgi:lysophospholipase L1-like esterase
LTQIHSDSPQTEILILGQAPVIDYAREARIETHEWINWRYRMRDGLTTFPVYISPYTVRAHHYLMNLAHERNYVKFIPIDDLFPLINGRIDAQRGNKLLYDDGNHLSESGSMLVINKITPVILDTLKNKTNN